MFASSSFLALLLALAPQQSIRPDTLPAAAEELDGIELLRWRLRVLSHVRHERPEQAAAILESLLGGDPSRHWSRALLAAEAARFRLLNSAASRAIPPSIFAIKAADMPPDPGPQLEEWVESRYPFVDPSRLIRCSRHAASVNRTDDALYWLQSALALTPVSDPGFMTAAHEVASAALRSDAPNPIAVRTLEELAARSFSGAEELMWLESRLGALAAVRPRGNTDTLCDQLLQAGVRGRLGVALELRLTTRFPRQRSMNLERHALWSDLVADCESPLDRAALLHRLSANNGELEDQYERLDAALRFSPPSALSQQIAGDLLRVSVREHRDRLRPLLDEWFSGPPASWALLLPAVDEVLSRLAAEDDRELLAQLLELLLPKVGSHPVRARFLQLGATLQDDPQLAIRALLECLEVKEPARNYSRAPQIEALRYLAACYESTGHYSEAAEAFSRALAFLPPPEPYRPFTFGEYRDWTRLRVLAGHEVRTIAEDLLLLLDNGLAISPAQQDQILCSLLTAFDDPFKRQELFQVLLRMREQLVMDGAPPEEVEFIERAGQFTRVDSPLLSRMLDTTRHNRLLPDVEVYDMMSEALECGSVSVALSVLRIAARRPARAGARFSTPIPAELQRVLIGAVPGIQREEDLQALATLFVAQPNAEVREALIVRLQHVQGRAHTVMIEAAARMMASAPTPLNEVETAVMQNGLVELSRGDLTWLPLAVEYDSSLAVAAIEELFVRAGNSSPRPDSLRRAAVERLAEYRPKAAADLLLGLSTHTEPGVRTSSVNSLVNLRELVPVERRQQMLTSSALDSEVSVRHAVLAAIRNRPLQPFEVALLLSLLSDSTEVVRAAAETRLGLLNSNRDLGLLIEHLLEHPEACRRPAVIQTLQRLTRKKLPVLYDADAETCRRVLGELHPLRR